MDILIIFGTALVVAGLGLLFYCILSAGRIQRGGLSQEDATEALGRLLPFNLGGVALSALGLMCVVIGLLL